MLNAMKLGLPLKGLTLLLSLSLFSAPLSAQIKKYQEQFSNLSPAEQKKFSEALVKSTQLLSEKRFFETLHAIAPANKTIPNHPSIRIIKASIDVQLRNFEEAEAQFLSLHEEFEDNLSTAFNLGEMYFVQSKWEKALQYFKVSNSLAVGSDQSTFYYLIEFKKFICYIKLNQQANAEEIARKYDYLTDSPIHYYIEFITSLEKGDIQEAIASRARAIRIFSNKPSDIKVFDDSLAETNYLKLATEKIVEYSLEDSTTEGNN